MGEGRPPTGVTFELAIKHPSWLCERILVIVLVPMSLPNKFPVSHSPHPCTHISHPQHTPRSTLSSTLNPAVSFPVCLLLPTTLVQGIIAAHLDSCLPISYPFSGLCGSPLAYWTHIIENHLPPVSLRSHHSPLRMPVKAPCCLPNHINTPQVLGCKARYQLALLYLTASVPAQLRSCASLSPGTALLSASFQLRCLP